MSADRAASGLRNEPRTDILESARRLRTGAITAEGLTGQCLARIAERNGVLNAFVAVFDEQAREQARLADRELASGRDRGPLHGIPISLKDLVDVAGTPTTAASRVREGHVATGDAAIVARLRQAGAVILGKTNLHEFALGTTNEESAFGPVRHPLDDTRGPGGSSGGSAASVLDGMACASIGTDTGGSIRIPAAACGLVGLKPTNGEIGTHGVVPLSATLDCLGPITHTVSDAAVLYDVLRDQPAAMREPAAVSGLRVGVLGEYFRAWLDPEIAAGVELAEARLQEAGAAVDTVTVAHAADTGTIYVLVALAEAAAYHASALESRPDLYTPGVRNRLELGRYILAEDYVRAMQGREVLRAEVDALLDGHDVLLLPTLPVPAPRLGTTMVRIGGSEEPLRTVMLRLTQLFNITGHPAISIPCGRTMQMLPIGLQLVGGRGRTDTLLSVARAIEAHVGPGMSL